MDKTPPQPLAATKMNIASQQIPTVVNENDNNGARKLPPNLFLILKGVLNDNSAINSSDLAQQTKENRSSNFQNDSDNEIANNAKDKNERPPFSYKWLIMMAMKYSSTHTVNSYEICKYITDHFPYYRKKENLRKNISFCLSANKCFVKVPGPGHQWTLDTNFLDIFDRFKNKPLLTNSPRLADDTAAATNPENKVESNLSQVLDNQASYNELDDSTLNVSQVSNSQTLSNEMDSTPNFFHLLDSQASYNEIDSTPSMSQVLDSQASCNEIESTPSMSQVLDGQASCNEIESTPSMSQGLDSQAFYNELDSNTANLIQPLHSQASYSETDSTPNFSHMLDTETSMDHNSSSNSVQQQQSFNNNVATRYSSSSLSNAHNQYNTSFMGNILIPASRLASNGLVRIPFQVLTHSLGEHTTTTYYTVQQAAPVVASYRQRNRATILQLVRSYPRQQQQQQQEQEQSTLPLPSYNSIRQYLQSINPHTQRPLPSNVFLQQQQQQLIPLYTHPQLCYTCVPVQPIQIITLHSQQHQPTIFPTREQRQPEQTITIQQNEQHQYRHEPQLSVENNLTTATTTIAAAVAGELPTQTTTATFDEQRVPTNEPLHVNINLEYNRCADFLDRLVKQRNNKPYIPLLKIVREEKPNN